MLEQSADHLRHSLRCRGRVHVLNNHQRPRLAEPFADRPLPVLQGRSRRVESQLAGKLYQQRVHVLRHGLILNDIQPQADSFGVPELVVLQPVLDDEPVDQPRLATSCRPGQHDDLRRLLCAS